VRVPKQKDKQGIEYEQRIEKIMPTGVYKRTKEIRRKLSEGLKGHPVSMKTNEAEPPLSSADWGAW